MPDQQFNKTLNQVQYFEKLYFIEVISLLIYCNRYSLIINLMSNLISKLNLFATKKFKLIIKLPTITPNITFVGENVVLNWLQWKPLDQDLWLGRLKNICLNRHDFKDADELRYAFENI